MRSLALLFVIAIAVVAVAQDSDEPPVMLHPRDMSRIQTQDRQTTREVKPWIVPAGTKVPVRLQTAISTKTARPGDPVYAMTVFPVAIDDKMMIPSGTYVQGTIANVKRAGRVKGRAEILFHFTTLVFPSGYTVTLPGSVDNVDSDVERPKDKEGTIEHSGEKGKDVGTIASTGATGAIIGAAARGGKGAAVGAGMGGAVGLAIAMLSRGSDIQLPSGTHVEMVLNREVKLDPAKIRRIPRMVIDRQEYMQQY
jgi:hypothetical protein